LKDRYQRISQIEFSNFLDDVVSDRASLEKWVWSRVTDRMYDDKDSLRLNVALENQADKRSKVRFSVLMRMVKEF
jgi:hypothetical protein